MSERIDQVLLFLDFKTPKPGYVIDLNSNPQTDSFLDPQAETYYRLLMCSESADWSDLYFMLEHLLDRKLIRRHARSGDDYYFLIEIPGFERIEHLKQKNP